MIKSKIVIATGGTGGHVFPAYSLMNILEKDYNLLLTTDKRGFNYLKNYQNLNLIKIPSSPFIKKYFKIFVFNYTYFFFNNQIIYIIIIFQTKNCYWNGRIFIFSYLRCRYFFKN